MKKSSFITPFIKIATFCFLLLGLSQSSYSQALPATNQQLYVSTTSDASAVIGYNVNNNLSLNIASDRFFFGSNDLRPGVGMNYERSLYNSQWNIQTGAYLHTNAGFRIIPALQVGLNRGVALSDKVKITPGLSLFSYHPGFVDIGQTGMLFDAPVSYQLHNGNRIFIAPMVRFNGVGAVHERTAGITAGFNW